MGDLLRWWLTLEFFGMVGLPLVAWLFPGLRDRGVSLCRIVGLVVVAYPVWLLSHAGDIFSTALIVVLFFLLGLVSLVVFLLDLPRWREAMERPGELIVSELVFHSAFLLLALIRAYNPEIEGMWKGGGSEKFMDLNFVNSILNSAGFPPRDNWLAGFPINYYYYGYYLAAVLIKLTGVLPHVGYNLMVVTVYALAVQGLWGLLRNLGCRWYWALAGIWFAFFATNLKAPGLSIEEHGTMLPWRASRVIDLPNDRTINEFPWFSFLWSDLHGHLSGFPFQTALLGLCWGAVASAGSIRASRAVWSALLLSLVYGASVVGNAWDAPAFAVVVVFSALASFPVVAISSRIKDLVFSLFLRLLAVAGVFLLFYRPFFSHFIPPTSGYNLVPWETKTPLGLLLLIFGAAFGALLLPTAWSAARVLIDLFAARTPAEADTRQGQSGRAVILVATVVGTLLWAVGLLYVRSKTGTLAGTLSPALLGSLLLLALLGILHCWAGDRAEKEEAGAERFVSLLLFLATGLILTCEFVVVKDFYGGDSLRMNTIFKFHLQAWVLLAITLAFASDRFLTSMRGVIPERRALGLTGAVLQAGIVVVFVVWTAVGSWKLLAVKCSHFESKPTLDGLAYAFPEESERRVVGERDMSTEDARAILWLLDLQRFEYDPKRIILESPGDPYSIYGRVSAFSGIPTPLGVPNHEGIWNGKKVEASSEIKARSRDVETIYRTNDFRKAKQLLEKYGVTHVFWGTVERRKFGAAARKKFEKYMVALKTFEDTTIYSGYQDVPIQEDFVEEVPPRPLAEARELVDPSHPFDQPRGITVGPDGSVYVCNSKKGTVEVFSAEGTWRRTIGAPGQSPGSGQLSPEYSGPGGVAVGPDGALYVADTWNHRVAVFAPDGTYQREIRGDFWGPRNLAFFKDLLIVADTGKHRLVALRPDGSAPRPIGQQGRGLGEFTEPVGLAVRGDSLFVADVGNQRVQVLGPDFLPRAEFPVLGWEDQVGTEAYMAFDSAGRLWLTDSGGNRVQRYSAEGKLEAVFGPVCPPAGTLRAVKGIALRGEEILLSDFGNNRLVIWREN